MPKPFDVSKFRKTITKGVPGLSVGFRDPDTWISTGNYTLNKLISGHFERGIPLGKVSVLAGESGSGKSLISASIVKNAQDAGIFVVLIDTENALDEAWLHALDVSTESDKLLKLNMAMIDDVAKVINEFMESYKNEFVGADEGEEPKVLFVIDSLGMLMTPTDLDQFKKGDLKGDLGRKPKALTALVRNCVNMFGQYNIGMLCTNHSYQSQDMFDPDDKISGGQGFIYASSIVVAMRKLKLKEDEEGNKISDVKGIRAACKVMKTRYAKPFETVQVKVPYETGLDPYSGLLEFFEAKGIVNKEGNKLKYVSLHTGEEIKEFRKKWYLNREYLDVVMNEFDRQVEEIEKSEEDVDDIDEAEETDETSSEQEDQ